MTQAAKRVPPRHRTLRVVHRLAAVPTTRRALVADLHSIGVAPEVVDEAGNAFQARIQAEEEERKADEAAAQAEFDAAVEEIQKKANELIAAQQRGERIDPQQMVILQERLRLTREAAQKRLDVKADARQRKFDRDRREAGQRMEQSISQTQFSYKILAILLPTIPPLLVGIGVFVYRRFQELEGISSVRLR